MVKHSRYIVQLLHAHRKSISKQSGFTLIEMLVIAPLVLIVLAGLISAMVAMIGDSIVANAKADTAYSVQDTLSQIERDTRVATSFMNEFSFFDSPQGRNGGTAPFSYTSNNDLIFTQQATSASPYDDARQLIYYADRPAGCGDDLSGNRSLFNRTVYFLNTNGDGTKSLWRRTIVSPWNRNATHDGDTVCSSPWQRNSCPTGSTVTNTPGATCQSIDQKMLDNVTSFVPTFYTSSGAVTTDPTAALSVSISISVAQKVSGHPISQTSIVRATRLNNVPATARPIAPNVSIFNPAVNSYNNPILTSVQWNSPGAYTYIVSTKVGAGAWSSPTTTSDSFMSIPSEMNTQISIKVTAVNDSGKSDVTTKTFFSSLFSDVNLADGWSCYSTAFNCPSFTRTSAGVVILRGLVTGGTGTITTLPEGFRPRAHYILSIMSTGNAVARVDVYPDGTVSWIGGSSSTWMSLDNIRFLSSDFDSSLTWTTPTLYSWTNYSGFGPVQFTKDNVGRAHVYGVLKAAASYPPANYSYMTNTPSGYQPSLGDIYPGMTGYLNYSSYGILAAGTQFRTNTGNSWKNIDAMYYPGSAGTWSSISLQNSWVNYGGASYSTAQYTKSSDKIVTVRGLIKNGTTTKNTTIFTLPVGYRPTKSLVFMTAGSNPGEIPARIDILSDGIVRVATENGAIGNTFLSLAGISFYQEQ